MKILIYTGYHNPKLSKQVWLDKGIGGTEYYQSKWLNKQDWIDNGLGGTEYCYLKLAEA